MADDYRTRLPSQQQPLSAQLLGSLERKDHTQGGEDNKACLCPWKREYLRGTSWAEGADVLVMVRNSEGTRLTLWFSLVNSCFSFWGMFKKWAEHLRGKMLKKQSGKFKVPRYSTNQYYIAGVSLSHLEQMSLFEGQLLALGS